MIAFQPLCAIMVLLRGRVKFPTGGNAAQADEPASESRMR